ncbi:ParA family protein [Mycoplasma sp. HU2014]|uniref:ParA family protein n=1 Tax=Mycoplasma sp. HU2014 TaxID=1664275 RepID=UPI00067E3873|nr:ParA family protein [Mycoplasma sp. HU2014]KNG79786.1 ParA/Soj family protein [Mycoplasma sp. HU2014]
MFHNNKGGVGKTLLTTNLAIYLGKQGKKVLIIDFDTQRSITWNFTDSMLLESFKMLQPYEKPEVIKTLEENVWILPADNRAIPPFEIPDMEDSFIEKEKEIFNNFDYIFFDVKPGWEKPTIISYKFADSIILVSDGSSDSKRLLLERNKNWSKATSNRNLPNNIKAVLLNNFDPKTKQHKVTKKLLEKDVGQYLLKTIIPTKKTIENSPNRGQKRMFELVWWKDIFLKLVEELKERGIL